MLSFVLPKDRKQSFDDEKIVFETQRSIKKISLLGRKDSLKYTVDKGTITIQVPAKLRTKLADVIDVELK